MFVANSAKRTAALAALVGVLVAGCGGDANQAENRAQVKVLPTSYCQQDPVVGNVDFILKLKNVGPDPARDLIANLEMFDEGGDRTSSFGEALVDINVPARAPGKEIFGSATFSGAKTLTRCQVRLVGPGAPSGEVRVKVRQ